MSNDLYILSLGQVAILRGGHNLASQLPQKVRALVIYAARMKRPLPREMLADLFWQDSGGESASRSLRVALVPLRKLLDPFLDITRDQLQLISATLDANHFEQEAGACLRARVLPEMQVDRLEQTARLYAGDFLTDFSISDSAAFETWAQAERSLLRSTFIEVGGLLLDAYTATRQIAAGIALEMRLLAADPLHEKTLRRAMRFYAGVGDRTAALRTFERGQSLLWDELGVEPEDETIQLYEAIAAKAAGSVAGKPPVPQPVLSVNDGIFEQPSADGGQNIARPLKPPAPLPHTLTPLFGREREIDFVLSRLGNARLVTLTGGGGSGKTRLALAVAARAQALDQFADGGVLFISLESLQQHGEVGNTLCRTLGIRESVGQRVADAIAAWLGEKSALLVLDNFEHVLDAAPLLDELLRRSPRLHLLVTSREPLALYGEYRFHVPTLDAADAAALFVDRVQAVAPHFNLTDEVLEQIDAICERLDYQPLAIELAASRAGAIPLEQIRVMLDQPLQLLTTHMRGLPERQRAIENTIAWSYHLLSPPEKQLLRSLAVFSGSFNLRAARQVCGDLSQWLNSLADKHLVQRQIERPSTAGDSDIHLAMRYRLLETIRHYALEQLQAEGEYPAAHAHSDYYLRFAEHADRIGRERSADLWRSRIEGDLGNMLVAIERAAADAAGAEVECRFIIALSEFWYRRGYFHQARAYSRHALRLRNRLPSALLAGILGTLGLASHGIGDMAEADRCQSEAYLLYQSVGDTRNMAYIRFCQSVRTPDAEDAMQLAEEGLQLARQIGEDQMIGLLCISIGNTMTLRGEAEDALPVFTEAIARLHKIDQYATTIARIGFAFAHMETGAFTAALAEFQSAQRTLLETGSPMAALVWAELGDLYFASGQIEEAWQCYLKGVRLASEKQDSRRLRRLQRVGATLAWVRQDEATMRELYEASFRDLDAETLANGDLSQLLVGAAHIALLLAEQGNTARAAQLDAAIQHVLAQRHIQPIYLLRHFQAQTAQFYGSGVIAPTNPPIEPAQLFAFALECLAALPHGLNTATNTATIIMNTATAL